MKKLPTQMIKKFIGMCGFLILLQSAQAQFVTPVYEPFSEYPEGERLRTAASSGVFWNIGNSLSSVSSPIISTSYALSYPGLLADPNVPARGILGATGTGRTHGATFTAQTSGTNYASFLLSISNFPTADRPIIGVNGANSGTPSPSSGDSVWITPLGQLKIAKNNSATPMTNTTAPLTPGSTYLVVLAYKFPTGEVDLWLNPTVLGDNANIPVPTIFGTNGSQSTTLQSICLYSGTGIAVSTNLFDEIRVTNTWAGATPSSPAPGNIYSVTGGGTGCPGDSFPVGLSGSDSSSVVYLLYTNGSPSGQVISGANSAITFGPQPISGNYTVLASNILNANVGWMSGSVNVSVRAGPVITQQPAPVLVATNGFATFSVVAAGDSLSYRWYRNGAGLNDGGHVSGSSTPILTITPATTADAATTSAGYYVIITNICGLSATSTTNALTLQRAGNLVWQGGNPNTNWDLASTLNWTNPAGTAMVFNAGDNVFFDDSSTNQTVNLVGSVTPTLVTENSGLNYVFNGAGAIAGPGSLVMNGSGMLTISNANTYSGGTTISNGSLVLKLGSQTIGNGPVTLAGGKLEIGVASGVATAGISNINVTANSTLQLDVAGTFAFNELGTLTGSPSSTLTVLGFLNNASGTFRIRLYGGFTNNSQVVLSTVGNELELATYLPSGNQMYNGVISGIGGRLVPRTAGNLILNAANTFNDSGVVANNNGPSGYSVLLSSGSVGVGADSVSSSPPTIDSSPLGTGNLGIQVGAEGGTSTIFASGAAHTVANPIVYTSATNTVTFVIGGTNSLTLSGAFNLSGADGTGGTNRVIQVNNTGLTTFSGVISDTGLVCGITKTGTNILILSAVNTYTGPTTVGSGTLLVNGQIDAGGVNATNGTLGGSGTILGPVTVQAPGILAPGTSSIGTLTVNNNLTLSGNALFKVNKSVSPSNDLVSVSGALGNTGTGTLTVSNLGPTLVIGDSFHLFNKAVVNGGTIIVAGGGVNWTNKLATDGSIAVLSIANPVNLNPTNIVASITGNVLSLSWPADHTGWQLQLQTNSLATGLYTNWVTLVGTELVHSTNFIVTPGNPAVFYRMIHP